ncbi:MAG: acyl-CoA synthetase FdrA [Breznakia sp.]
MRNFIDVRKNEYYDSVTLMSLSAKIERSLENVQLLVAMATPINVDLLKNMQFEESLLASLTANDLVIALSGADEALFEKIQQQVEESLSTSTSKSEKKDKKTYHTIAQALQDQDFNLGVISLPGKYAFIEAKKLLDHDIHVMLFSDNMSVEEEISLKKYAIRKNLLVMGPDCGTSILNGKGLCFANHAKLGTIGIISASGTGLQEVVVNIDKLDKGISQAIGVGGRDLSKEVGGLMMLAALDALERDEKTETIVLISKPPVPEVKDTILQKLKSIKKKVIVYFIDTYEESNQANVMFAKNLYDTAYKAVYFKEDTSAMTTKVMKKYAFHNTQKYIRGLFCGGTLCLEALSILRENKYEVYSNIAKHTKEKLLDPHVSVKHSMIDLGDDFFTNGKPHPMIEPSIRLDRIIEEAQCADTKVILMDFELGYGAHEDPVGSTIDYIEKAQQIAKDNNREIAIVAYVLGSQGDYQNLQEQEKILVDAGVIIAKSNVDAVNIAMDICKGDQ